MPYKIQRAQTLIMQELSVVIQRELKDPRVKNVTITGVKLSADLRNAVVYYSVLGTEEDTKHAQEGLTHAAGFLRTQIAHNIDMKYTPQLRFEYDDSSSRAAHIAELLRQAKKNDNQTP